MALKSTASCYLPNNAIFVLFNNYNIYMEVQNLFNYSSVDEC